MATDPIRLSRQQLYDKVWSSAMYRVAAELGLSGRGLAKICGRHGIPFPGRGYWAQKAAGHFLRQPPLKPPKEAGEDILTFTRDSTAAVEKEAPELPAVPVQDQLSAPHPLVEATRKALRKTKTADDGRLHSTGAGALHVIVSAEAMDRALRILDALAKALESRGLTLRIESRDNQTRTIVEREEDSVILRLFECTTRSLRPLSPAQEKDKQRNPWKYSDPQYDFTPNGQLSIALGEGWSGSGLRRTWSDGKRTTLDRLLPKVVLGIEHQLDYEKNSREEREAAARQREEAERRRVAAAMRQFQADRRAEIVEEKVRYSRLAKEMREWSGQLRTEEVNELGAKWLEWAEGYAGRLEAASKSFPAFDAEPTYEDRRKYRMDSYW